jgi:chromosome segregation ATPase
MDSLEDSKNELKRIDSAVGEVEEALKVAQDEKKMCERQKVELTQELNDIEEKLKKLQEAIMAEKVIVKQL